MAETLGGDSDGVPAAMGNWQQGDVAVGIGPFPVLERCSDDGGNAQFRHDEFDGAVVLSQTCDIVRAPKNGDHRTVEVAALVRLPPDMAKDAARGRFIRYVPVPSDERFADLGVVMTIEKDVLRQITPIRGCRTTQEQRDFAKRLARRVARFPFPDGVVATLKPLTDFIKRKHGKESGDGQLLLLVKELRVSTDPDWSAEAPHLTVHFIVPEEIPAAQLDELLNAAERWAKRCSESEAPGRVTADVARLSEMTALEYVESQSLDLDHISPVPEDQAESARD